MLDVRATCMITLDTVSHASSCWSVMCSVLVVAETYASKRYSANQQGKWEEDNIAKSVKARMYRVVI
jgi:hypothetical protein